MTYKKFAQKMFDLLGIDLPIKYSTDFYLEIEDGEIIALNVPSPKHRPNFEQLKIERATQLFTIKLLKEHGVDASYGIFAILHEIGHIVCGITDIDEYSKDLALLEEMYRQNFLNETQYIELYNEMEDEKNANMWAIEFLQENVIPN